MTFNIFILNTDFHKKTDKNKMKLEVFTKNLKMVFSGYMPSEAQVLEL